MLSPAQAPIQTSGISAADLKELWLRQIGLSLDCWFAGISTPDTTDRTSRANAPRINSAVAPAVIQVSVVNTLGLEKRWVQIGTAPHPSTNVQASLPKPLHHIGQERIRLAPKFGVCSCASKLSTLSCIGTVCRLQRFATSSLVRAT